MKKIIVITLFLFLGIVKLSIGQGTGMEVGLRTKHFNIEKSTLALEGYDVVSYFNGKPQKGSPSISYTLKGIKYYFVTVKDLELFKDNPEKYEPAYGGWCAYAMGAKGEKVEVDPETFKIVNGKLYLFYNAFFNNTLTEWNKDEINLKKKADANWLKIYK
jgi:YHS domain-containing protein